jgi:ribosomal protein L40E
MYCRNCGKEVADQAIACVACGAAPLRGDRHCQHCGAETQPQAFVCVKCGVRLASAAQFGLQGRSQLVAGLLGIILGGLGVHRFYLGYTAIGVAQLLVTFATCGLGAVWGFIEGILILTGGINVDADGKPLVP